MMLRRARTANPNSACASAASWSDLAKDAARDSFKRATAKLGIR